jgi:uncharacterized protein (TIGR00730 family)
VSDPSTRICVFAGSSPGARGAYAEAAKELARELAARGIGIVFGGGKVGLMGVLAEAAIEAGGHVTGVIPEGFVDKGLAHPGVAELRVVASMHERKAMMAELSDGFIALPGGLGTFEEILEVLTWAQLGIHAKPCGLLDVEGYYRPLVQFLENAVAERFLKAEHASMLMVEPDAATLLDRFRRYSAPALEKWLDRP